MESNAACGNHSKMDGKQKLFFTYACSQQYVSNNDNSGDLPDWKAGVECSQASETFECRTLFVGYMVQNNEITFRDTLI